MNGHIVMYVIGFAIVWSVIVFVSAIVAGFRRVNRDWDRALRDELLGNTDARFH
jgi:hypothetical protein